MNSRARLWGGRLRSRAEEQACCGLHLLSEAIGTSLRRLVRPATEASP
jgi:hypothetical protein